MKKLIFTTIFAFLCSFFAAEKVSACVCSMPPTVYQEFADSDAVFIGKAVNSRDITTNEDKITSIRDALFSGTQRIYQFEIVQTYKGVITKSVEINSGNINTSCSGGFSIGKTYLIYADKKGTNEFSAVTACGLIEEFENAKDQISIINDILQKKPEPQIYGSLLFSDDNDKTIFLPNTKVLLKSEKKTFEAITDENGVFRFYKIPKGNYAILPVLPETRRVDFADTEAVIVTGRGRIYTEKFADDIEELTEDFEDSKDELNEDHLRKSMFSKFYLANNYGVSGRIMDNSGKSTNCKQIGLINIDSITKLDLRPTTRHTLWNLNDIGDNASAWKWCNDDGSYNISAEKSGKYFLATEIEIGNSLTKVFFHPQTDDFKNAEIIDFDRPKQLKIDIKLPSFSTGN